MISTRDLSLLPDVPALRRLMQSLAMLDAIPSPDWQYRYFSFNSKWAPGEEMGSLRNGAGDEGFALFNITGCWMKGFDHESPMSPYASDPPKVADGMFDGVPSAFASCLTEPAFNIMDTTFCIWRSVTDGSWRRGRVRLWNGETDIDGSAWMLSLLDGDPSTYQQFATDYYEVNVSLEAVRSVYNHQPLTSDIIKVLSPDLSRETLAKDVIEIGYPV